MRWMAVEQGVEHVHSIGHHVAMPVDPATPDSENPRNFDGRSCPEQLKVYARLDEELLPIAARLGQFTPDVFAARIENRKTRVAVPRWLASAGWRGLIERRGHRRMTPLRIIPIYGVTKLGLARL